MALVVTSARRYPRTMSSTETVGTRSSRRAAFGCVASLGCFSAAASPSSPVPARPAAVSLRSAVLRLRAFALSSLLKIDDCAKRVIVLCRREHQSSDARVDSPAFLFPLLPNRSFARLVLSDNPLIAVTVSHQAPYGLRLRRPTASARARHTTARQSYRLINNFPSMGSDPTAKHNPMEEIANKDRISTHIQNATTHIPPTRHILMRLIIVFAILHDHKNINTSIVSRTTYKLIGIILSPHVQIEEIPMKAIVS